MPVPKKTEAYRIKQAARTGTRHEHAQRRKQAKILKLFGKIDFDPALDYKRQRLK